MHKFTVYTDGSCLGNPGPGGWAFLLVEDEKRPSEKVIHSQSGYVFHTTNNRMEMTAFLMSLKFLAHKFPTINVEINSDSKLLVQSINEGWKRKANPDLWAEIDRYITKINFKLFWVKAHADNLFNNQCDELAQTQARKAQRMLSRNSKLSQRYSVETNKKTDDENEKQSALF